MRVLRQRCGHPCRYRTAQVPHPADRVVPGTDDPALGFIGSQQCLWMAKLAVNQAGAVAVVNSRFRAGVSSVVRLMRGQAVPEP